MMDLHDQLEAERRDRADADGEVRMLERENTWLLRRWETAEDQARAYAEALIEIVAQPWHPCSAPGCTEHPPTCPECCWTWTDALDHIEHDDMILKCAWLRAAIALGIA
jgi:hypothetical protein